MAGHLRRSVGTGWQIGFGNLGGFVATLTFLSTDESNGEDEVDEFEDALPSPCYHETSQAPPAEFQEELYDESLSEHTSESSNTSYAHALLPPHVRALPESSHGCLSGHSHQDELMQSTNVGPSSSRLDSLASLPPSQPTGLRSRSGAHDSLSLVRFSYTTTRAEYLLSTIST